MDLALLLIAAGYSLLEGIREYLFYTINRKGGFPDIPTDKLRKTVNVTMFTLIFVLSGVILRLTEFQMGLLLLASASIRWVVLDGILNAARGLHFFYVGTVATTDVTVRNVGKLLGVPPELVMALSKVLFLGAFITLYIFNLG